MKNIVLIVILFSTFMFPQFSEDTLSYQTDELTITGDRTGKSINEIPFSIYSQNLELIPFQKTISIDDVLRNIPGLQLQSRYGNHDVRVSIRGNGNRSNSGIRGVRILLDGIPESEPDGQTRIEAIDFNSVSNVEIAKGNLSSMYTNAPGGVINFSNNLSFTDPFIAFSSQVGSNDMSKSSFKFGFKNGSSKLSATYSYHNFGGYRPHSNDNWHIFNSVYENFIDESNRIEIPFYFVSGLIKLPGSLNLKEYNTDPYQAASREVKSDFRRTTTKARLGIKYLSAFSDKSNLEITAYGTIKKFERIQSTYRNIDRFGVGGNTKFSTEFNLLSINNEFVFGTDFFLQGGPIKEYGNISGLKDDDDFILQTDERVLNTGVFLQNNFVLVEDYLTFLLTGRYDFIKFRVKKDYPDNYREDKVFEAFTPKAALNLKINSDLSFYTSFGLGFDTPAFNELDYPGRRGDNLPILINPIIKAQESKNFEIGIKSKLINEDETFVLLSELAYFRNDIKNGIIPYEVGGDVYYRNSAKLNRNGIELRLHNKLYENLSLILAYTYSDFKYKDYQLLKENDSTSTSISLNNNAEPAVPEHSFSFDGSYSLMINSKFHSLISLYGSYTSEMFTSDLNLEQTEAYLLLNSKISLMYYSGDMEYVLSVGANNLTDKKYVGFININSASNRFYEPGMPRSLWAVLSLNYGL